MKIKLKLQNGWNNELEVLGAYCSIPYIYMMIKDFSCLTEKILVLKLIETYRFNYQKV